MLGCDNLVEVDLSGNTIGKTAKHLVEVIHKLGSYGKLEKLYLSGCSFPEDQCAAILKSLSLCKQLTYLDLSNNRIQNAGKHLAESINQWGVNPPLQELYLCNCGLHEDDCAELLQSLLGCINLVEIVFSGNNIGKASKYLVEVIRNSGHLQKLWLRKSSIPEQCWGEILNSLGTRNTLTFIHLSDNTLGESASQLACSIKQLGDNPTLQRLGLYNCSIPEDACCELISALFSCTRLTHLALSGSHLRENGLHLIHYLETITDTLEGLCLDRCFIPVDVVGQILSLLSQCKKLSHLTVPGKVTGTFSNFLPNPLLEFLGLIDTELNEEDLDHLTGLVESQKLPNLEKLMLYGNSLDQMEDKFEELLEACVIHCDKKLVIFLCDNNLQEEFMDKWNNRCKHTKITLDFKTDLDEYNGSTI